MAARIAVPKERRADETRVAASPDTVKKFIGLGLDVVVETGAGGGASFSDEVFSEAGASIAADYASTVGDADIVLKIQRPLTGGQDGADEISPLKKGALLLAIISPTACPDDVQAYADAGIVAVAMDLMPRISRAQSMDVLSSQSNLAGYKAVIDAAAEFGRAFPMMMTAAGTVAPARVMVFGVGVAGLQAIATAKRLGAIVSATDVRPATKEQVESLGGTFVMVESEETESAETEGGYAREMSDDYKAKQAALIAKTLAKQDIAICTALIPGRAAPVLITGDMVKSMKQGSVIVDMAVEAGGNCELSKPGEIVNADSVKIMGLLNLPGRLAADTSALYARNMLNYLTPMIDGETGALNIDWEDEVVTGCVLTRDGAVVHPLLTGGKE